MDVVVRPRTSADIAHASSALIAVYNADGYPVEGVDNPEAWLSPPGLLGAWVAETPAQVVGHVAVSRPAGEGAVALWIDRSGATEDAVGVLARLFVLPEVRKRAVGERLMRAAEEYATDHGLRLVLDVMRKDTSAIRLYRRLGWLEIGSIDHRFGEGRQQEALAYVSPESR
ncbi:GNAT family N-acetyltransferase [Streptomyces sp. NBC_00838]|uniref:GNAT family N-acetyltransferase n=1 Tax=Streptomyces sp. NBC_00838 TaxID=2903680 RepID=UPI0038678750|nr:GNAT family N-acetyltransferase [Streptomyces sp. NBC_00838]